jgi:dihydropteroate synthase
MTPSPALALRTARGELLLGGRMRLMGIVNATPDSFSDAGTRQSLEERVELAARLLEQGAELIDIGGESGVTNRPAVAAEEEIERVVPLVERVAGELRALVSVDTYKPQVAEAAIAAGAAIVNDTSALRDPELAEVCARSGAGLVIMHTRAAPKERRHDRSLDGRIVADVKQLLSERIALALERGVAPEQIVIDPGPDFSKTPSQTVEVMRALRDLHAFGRPILLAVSRKDFIGAINGRRPRERLPGTLAALAHGFACGAHLARVHDVGAAREFLDVLEVLGGEREVSAELAVEDRLRWERQL